MLIESETLKAALIFNDKTGEITVPNMREVFRVIDSQPPFNPWHRVEEPPKEGQNVLTMDVNEDMETATYDGEGFEDSYGFYITNVLYWMPIEPPKEETK